MSSRVRISPRKGFEKTYEERLARTLRKVGPFVAVGDPTERLPLLGAARMYAADEEWQETVDELTDRAGVVLLHAGEGDGLAWEVRHVIELDAPERVILSLPLLAKRKEPSRQERYDAFRRRFGDAFPRAAARRDRALPVPVLRRGLDAAAARRARNSASGRRERAREGRCAAGGRVQDRLGPGWVRMLVYLIAFFAVLFAVAKAVETLTSSGS